MSERILRILTPSEERVELLSLRKRAEVALAAGESLASADPFEVIDPAAMIHAIDDRLAVLGAKEP